MNSNDPDFEGCFNLSSVGMFGHSFGGAATSICCYEDSRFDCGLALDGVFYNDYTPNGINQSFLMLLAEDRYDTPAIQKMWDLLNNDAYEIGINGSTYSSYTDVGILLKHFISIIPTHYFGFGTIAPKRHINITKSFETMFFEVCLKGRPVEDLIDLLSTFDEIEFMYK